MEPESSDSDESMNNLEDPIPKKNRARAIIRKASAIRKSKYLDKAAIEEQAFLKKVVQLEDQENKKKKARATIFDSDSETSESEASEN